MASAFVAVVISGCFIGAEQAGPLEESELENLTYVLPDRTVTLSDGIYEERPSPDSATYIVNVRLVDSYIGDLDGDGGDDAVVHLVDSPGGSGTFHFLAGVLNRPDGPQSVNAIALGDRITIEAVSIADGAVTLTGLTHGPDDPMCCPSVEETRTFELADGRLVETTTEE